MAVPTPPLTGACLCGSVTLQIEALPLLTVACHCRDCQKFTASAYSLTSMFSADKVAITGDLVIGGLRSEGRRHYFCAACKNFVYSQIVAAPERMNVRTSLLDRAADFAPYAEVMTQESMPWATVPAVRRFETGPASLEALANLMADYAAWLNEGV